jgi:dipeptidyl aminopeptidase/acylaminoacyl peptidase
VDRQEIAFGPAQASGSGLLFSDPEWTPAERRPGIVLCPGRTGDVANTVWLAEALTAAGFTCLGLRYRASGEKYQLQDVEDIRDGLQFLRDQPGVDGDRLAIAGHSRGAAAVLNTAVRYDGFRAVAALSPATDSFNWLAGMKIYAPDRYDLMSQARGDPALDPDFNLAISPLFHAAKIKMPVLLVHGTLDLVIPNHHSAWMHAALQRHGNTDSELELIPNVGHFYERGFAGYRLDEVSSKVVTWFRRWLVS